MDKVAAKQYQERIVPLDFPLPDRERVTTAYGWGTLEWTAESKAAAKQSCFKKVFVEVK